MIPPVLGGSHPLTLSHNPSKEEEEADVPDTPMFVRFSLANMIEQRTPAIPTEAPDLTSIRRSRWSGREKGGGRTVGSISQHRSSLE